MIIGRLTPAAGGGWSGAIKTLTINVKVQFVPNDNRGNDRAPAFRIFAGRSELGAAWWEQRKSGKSAEPLRYLRIRLDDPTLPEPILAMMFEAKDGSEAQLVWKHRNSS